MNNSLISPPLIKAATGSTIEHCSKNNSKNSTLEKVPLGANANTLATTIVHHNLMPSVSDNVNDITKTTEIRAAAGDVTRTIAVASVDSAEPSH